jgi:hypothetical protein
MKTVTKKDILQLAASLLHALKTSDLSRTEKAAALSIASLVVGVQTQDN